MYAYHGRLSFLQNESNNFVTLNRLFISIRIKNICARIFPQKMWITFFSSFLIANPFACTLIYANASNLHLSFTYIFQRL
jgi:hypothetical protein